MAEYIDRDALFKHYRALANIEWNKTVAPISWCDAYEEIADHIAELPTADVVPKSEAEQILNDIVRYCQQDVLFDNYFEEEKLYSFIDELKKKYTENL